MSFDYHKNIIKYEEAPQKGEKKKKRLEWGFKGS